MSHFSRFGNTYESLNPRQLHLDHIVCAYVCGDHNKQVMDMTRGPRHKTEGRTKSQLKSRQQLRANPLGV